MWDLESRLRQTVNGKRQIRVENFSNSKISRSKRPKTILGGGGGGRGGNEQFALDVTVDLPGGKLKIPPKKSLKRELLWQKDDNTLQTGPATGV